MDELTKYDMLVGFYRELTKMRNEYFSLDLQQRMASRAADVEELGSHKNAIAEKIARFVLFPKLHMSDRMIDKIDDLIKEPQ